MSLTKGTARALAINYACFLDAVREKDAADIRLYGQMLTLSQDETGIELLRKNSIDELVKAYSDWEKRLPGSKGPQS